MNPRLNRMLAIFICASVVAGPGYALSTDRPEVRRLCEQYAGKPAAADGYHMITCKMIRTHFESYLKDKRVLLFSDERAFFESLRGKHLRQFAEHVYSQSGSTWECNPIGCHARGEEFEIVISGDEVGRIVTATVILDLHPYKARLRQDVLNEGEPEPSEAVLDMFVDIFIAVSTVNSGTNESYKRLAERIIWTIDLKH